MDPIATCTPTRLSFDRTQTRQAITLSANTANQHPVAFKIQTNAPKRYNVKPVFGLLKPGTSTDVSVLLKQVTGSERGSSDKFLVRFSQVEDGSSLSTVEEQAQFWLKQKKNKLLKLIVFAQVYVKDGELGDSIESDPGATKVGGNEAATTTTDSTSIANPVAPAAADPLSPDNPNTQQDTSSPLHGASRQFSHLIPESAFSQTFDLLVKNFSKLPGDQLTEEELGTLFELRQRCTKPEWDELQMRAKEERKLRVLMQRQSYFDQTGQGPSPSRVHDDRKRLVTYLLDSAKRDLKKDGRSMDAAVLSLTSALQALKEHPDDKLYHLEMEVQRELGNAFLALGQTENALNCFNACAGHYERAGSLTEQFDLYGKLSKLCRVAGNESAAAAWKEKQNECIAQRIDGGLGRGASAEDVTGGGGRNTTRARRTVTGTNQRHANQTSDPIIPGSRSSVRRSTSGAERSSEGHHPRSPVDDRPRSTPIDRPKFTPSDRPRSAVTDRPRPTAVAERPKSAAAERPKPGEPHFMNPTLSSSPKHRQRKTASPAPVIRTSLDRDDRRPVTPGSKVKDVPRDASFLRPTSSSEMYSDAWQKHKEQQKQDELDHEQMRRIPRVKKVADDSHFLHPTNASLNQSKLAPACTETQESEKSPAIPVHVDKAALQKRREDAQKLHVQRATAGREGPTSDQRRRRRTLSSSSRSSTDRPSITAQIWKQDNTKANKHAEEVSAAKQHGASHASRAGHAGMPCPIEVYAHVNGETYYISLPPLERSWRMTVKMIKEKIVQLCDLSGIIASPRLFIAGVELEDDWTGDKVGLKHNTYFQIDNGSKGAAQTRPPPAYPEGNVLRDDDTANRQRAAGPGVLQLRNDELKGKLQSNAGKRNITAAHGELVGLKGQVDDLKLSMKIMFDQAALDAQGVEKQLAERLAGDKSSASHAKEEQAPMRQVMFAAPVSVYCVTSNLVEGPSSSLYSVTNREVVVNKKHDHQRFSFDGVFHESRTGRDEALESLFYSLSSHVDIVLDGGHANVFVYGDETCNKSSLLHSGVAADSRETRSGLMSKMVGEMFHCLSAENRAKDCQVTITAVELYDDVVSDILSPPNEQSGAHEVKQDASGKVYVSNLIAVQLHGVSDLEAIERIITDRKASRMREQSKNQARRQGKFAPLRSVPNGGQQLAHYIYSVELYDTDRRHHDTDSLIGRLTFVDLADADAKPSSMSSLDGGGSLPPERAHANRDLLALADVLAAQSRNDNHVPFRNSRLTYMMKDVLADGASSAFVIAANLSSAEKAQDGCARSLQFGAQMGAYGVKLKEADLNGRAKELLTMHSRIPGARVDHGAPQSRHRKVGGDGRTPWR